MCVAWKQQQQRRQKIYGDTTRQHRVVVESTSSLFGVREGWGRDIENHDKVVYEKRREMLFFHSSLSRSSYNFHIIYFSIHLPARRALLRSPVDGLDAARRSSLCCRAAPFRRKRLLRADIIVCFPSSHNPLNKFLMLKSIISQLRWNYGIFFSTFYTSICASLHWCECVCVILNFALLQR